MDKKFPTSFTLTAGAAGLALLLAIRLLPAWSAPLSSYGYDFGFYLYQLRHLAGFNLDNLAGLQGGFGNPLFLLSPLFPASPETFLVALALVGSVGLGLACWYYFRPSPLAALMALLLMAASIAQSETHSQFLLKTIVALPVLTLALAFVQDGRFGRAAVMTALLVALHRTSAIFFLITLAAYAVFRQAQRRQWKWLALEASVAGLAAAVLWLGGISSATTLFTQHNDLVREGVFLFDANLSGLWPYAALYGAGVAWHLWKHEHPLPAIFAGVLLLWIALQLPFYRRALIYADLLGILLTAPLLATLCRNGKRTAAVAVLALLVLSGLNLQFIRSQRPLISAADIEEIRRFSSERPGDFVLATSANDAPWLAGFLKDSRLGAPGLFEDRSTYEEWQDFWHGLNQTQFLWKYPRPLYLYQRDYVLPGPITDCLIPDSPHFYRYVCRN